MSDIKSYVRANEQRFLDELLEWLKIPSISNNEAYKDNVVDAARYLEDRLRETGAESIEVIPTDGHPIVYAEKMVDPSYPTVLVYGHYDVQPPDPLDLWDDPPFEPVVRKTTLHPRGAIFARGSCDDKGQLYMHVKAFEAMSKCGQNGCNIKFMLEGEEEIGSKHLEQFCRENAEKLDCDVVLLSDTSMISNDTPSITVGLRGLSYVEIEVTGPNRDLHSGAYGGAVANPINILCRMIATLQDDNNRITVPGFYDDVVELSMEEREELNKAPFDLKHYKEDLGINDVEGEQGFTSLERSTIRPTLDVNGIWGGYTGLGAKTILPSKAFAKLSMRLVPNQDPDKITQLFKHHFESIAPDSVKVDVRPHHGGKPAVTPIDTIEYKAAKLAMKESFGKYPIPTRSGGSIPIISLFEEILGVKSVMLGFGLDSDSIHSPNEHFGLFNYYKGIETIPLFYKYYAELKSN